MSSIFLQFSSAHIGTFFLSQIRIQGQKNRQEEVSLYIICGTIHFKSMLLLFHVMVYFF